jgi:hypothetical protein
MPSNGYSPKTLAFLEKNLTKDDAIITNFFGSQASTLQKVNLKQHSLPFNNEFTRKKGVAKELTRNSFLQIVIKNKIKYLFFFLVK